ncbi:MAG: glycosyltransferase family 4 protein [Pseudomonadaceae bacterium]
MMSFLLVASYPESVVRFRGELIGSLVEAGVVVHIAAPGLSGCAEVVEHFSHKCVVLHDIPLSRTGTNPVYDFITLLALIKLVIRVRPDMVMGYTVKPVIYGLIAAKFLGVPRAYALITGLGYAFQELESRRVKFGLQVLVRWLYSISLAHAYKVFFQNPDDQALFYELGLLKRDALSCVVNGSGVSLGRYAFSSIPRQARFTLIARLLGDKGIREYVSAARIVRGAYPSVQFDIVGWIDDNPDAISRSELDSWVDEGVVNFLGKLADVRPAIEKCSVYVLPSYREGTPRTVLEAMAMGRPIITTDAPGCRETVIDGENGFLVPVKSVDALVEAMTRFIEDPGLAVRMGKRSREIAEDKYDVHKVNAVMLKEMGIQ